MFKFRDVIDLVADVESSETFQNCHLLFALLFHHLSDLLVLLVVLFIGGLLYPFQQFLFTHKSVLDYFHFMISSLKHIGQALIHLFINEFLTHRRSADRQVFQSKRPFSRWFTGDCLELFTFEHLTVLGEIGANRRFPLANVLEILVFLFIPSALIFE